MDGEGASERRTVGRTMRGGESVEVDMPMPGKVRVTWRGRRVYFAAPKEATIGLPTVFPPEPRDERNLDDEEG